MNKFQQILAKTGVDVLEERAALMANDAEDAQDDIIKKFKKDIREIDKKLAKLNDLSVKTNDSLTPGENFQAEKWAAQTQELKQLRKVLSEKLQIAENTYNEFFKAPIGNTSNQQ